MNSITIAIIAVQVIIFLGVIGVLIYLIKKRLDDKEKETFEKRDN